MTDFQLARTHMVDNQLRPSDITTHEILDVMGNVPRELFIPSSARDLAYSDVLTPLPSDQGEGRVILPPVTIGKMMQLAEPHRDDIALVIGCSTGYCATVLAGLVNMVVAIEENTEFVTIAEKNFSQLSIGNIAVVTGPNNKGWAKEAPYDVIFIDGAVEVMPEDLIAQLKDGGRMVYIDASESVATAKLYLKIGEHGSSRYGFNAAAGILPGFIQETGFEF